MGGRNADVPIVPTDQDAIIQESRARESHLREHIGMEPEEVQAIKDVLLHEGAETSFTNWIVRQSRANIDALLGGTGDIEDQKIEGWQHAALAIPNAAEFIVRFGWSAVHGTYKAISEGRFQEAVAEQIQGLSNVPEGMKMAFNVFWNNLTPVEKIAVGMELAFPPGVAVAKLAKSEKFIAIAQRFQKTLKPSRASSTVSSAGEKALKTSENLLSNSLAKTEAKAAQPAGKARATPEKKAAVRAANAQSAAEHAAKAVVSPGKEMMPLKSTDMIIADSRVMAQPFFKNLPKVSELTSAEKTAIARVTQNVGDEIRKLPTANEAFFQVNKALRSVDLSPAKKALAAGVILAAAGFSLDKITSSQPVQSPEQPKTPHEQAREELEALVGKDVLIDTNGLRFRTSKSGGVVRGLLYKGAQVKVLEVKEGNYPGDANKKINWVKIQTSDGKEGWIAGGKEKDTGYNKYIKAAESSSS